MNNITNVIKIHSHNTLIWFITPWLVLLSSLAINILIGLLLGGTVAIYTGGIVSIYIFVGIQGTTILNDTFPFALGFNIRRTDYILGTIYAALGVDAIIALVLFLFSMIETHLIIDWGVNVHFFAFPFITQANPLEQFCIYFLPLVNIHLLGIAMGNVYQRFGQTGLWIVFCITALVTSIVSIICTRFQWWGSIFSFIGHNIASSLTIWLIPLSVIYAFASYLLLRKATV